MKISRNWLQTYFETPLPDDAAISDALTFHVFEIDGIEKHQDNSIFDVKVTPNRGHDCLSYQGIARELSAILRLPITLPVRLSLTSAGDGGVSVTVESDRCRRYIATRIRGVKVGPSPRWLAERLESMGQRSINNVVDATNFVMFNTGQPLHAFDADQLGNNNGNYAITVRLAHSGETVLALDDKMYALTENDLVIADGVKDVPIGIAGVKGGKPAGIGESTTDIIIESANFSGPSVRKTAAALKLRTDASVRFEQEISPILAEHGMSDVVTLIRELAGGTVAGMVDVYPAPVSTTTISVSLRQINDVIGITCDALMVRDIFDRLGFVYTDDRETFTVTPPIERLDLSIPEDLIEEVGRMIGYDVVPNIPLAPIAREPEVNHTFYTIERIRTYLVERGFSEVYTSVFAENGDVVIANKIDGTRPYLRTSLVTGVTDALARNVPNKDIVGIDQVKIFEIGTVWDKTHEYMTLALGVEQQKKRSGAVQYLRDLYQHVGLDSTVNDTGAVIEVLLEPIEHALMFTDTYDDLPLSTTERYQTFSRYPYIARDVALWTPAGTSSGAVEEVIREHAGELLVRVRLFDTFEKDGRISYAFRLVFQSMDRTLFDGDATARVEAVTAALIERGWEVR